MEAAEKLKISAENLNSMLTTSLQRISETRKRTKKLRAVSILRKRRKKKEAKIEVPSVFKKSVSKIKNKVSGGAGNLFGNILGFVSLLLLGVAITNIEMNYDVFFHDYHKTERKNRKLGHMTHTCATRGELEENIEEILKLL